MIQCHDKEKDCLRQQTMWKKGRVAENIGGRRALFLEVEYVTSLGQHSNVKLKRLSIAIWFRNQFVCFFLAQH